MQTKEECSENHKNYKMSRMLTIISDCSLFTNFTVSLDLFFSHYR